METNRIETELQLESEYQTQNYWDWLNSALTYTDGDVYKALCWMYY